MMPAKDEIATLAKGLNTLGIMPDAMVIGKFQKYLSILHEHQNRIHLISHADQHRVSLRHFLPSLAALPYIGEVKNACDIGAGAGFPSIPIKIVRPGIEFVLFESTKKKARFLVNLAKELELDGVEIIADRAETYNEKVFDLALARAAGKIGELLSVVDRLLNHGGRIIFYKSVSIDTEIAHAKKKMEDLKMTAKIERVHTPIENRPMALVILQKD